MDQEQPPVFNIQPTFQQPQLPPDQQPMQQQIPEGIEPKKKSRWKIWVFIIAMLIIAAGLGYYFFM